MSFLHPSFGSVWDKVRATAAKDCYYFFYFLFSSKRNSYWDDFSVYFLLKNIGSLRMGHSISDDTETN